MISTADCQSDPNGWLEIPALSINSTVDGQNVTEAVDWTKVEYGQEWVNQVSLHVMKRGIPIVSCFGLVGNFLSLLVLTKEKLHKSLTKMEASAHIGLIALAVSDLLFCVVVLLATTMPFQTLYTSDQPIIYLQLLSKGIITVFIITSTWLIVVMAAERYIAVFHPLEARNLISLCRTRTYVIVLFILCPMCTIPVFLENHIEEVICVDGTILYRVGKTPNDNIALRRMVWAVCFDFLPCVSLVYFNVCLIYKIHNAKQLRMFMTSRSAHTNAGGTAPGRKSERCVHRCSGKDCQNFNRCTNNWTTRLTPSSAERRSSYTLTIHGSQELSPHSREWHESQSGRRTLIGKIRGLHNSLQLTIKKRKHVPREMTPHSSPGYSGERRKGCDNLVVSNARRRSSDNALNSVTATLVAVVITFLVFVSPWEMLKFALEYSLPPSEQYKLEVAHILTNFMQVINFSFNFILYYVVNRSFRNTLRHLLMCNGRKSYHVPTVGCHLR